MVQSFDTPFVLNTRSLGRRAGNMIECHRQEISPIRIGTEMVAIEPGAEICMDLRLESVSEGILVTGTVCGDTEGKCARCLEPFQDAVTIFLSELFLYPERDNYKTSSEEEFHFVSDDQIELEQTLINSIGLELPMSPLCREDCPGLCPECGVLLSVAEKGHRHENTDPHWGRLAACIEAIRQYEQSNG